MASSPPDCSIFCARSAELTLFRSPNKHHLLTTIIPLYIAEQLSHFKSVLLWKHISAKRKAFSRRFATHFISRTRKGKPLPSPPKQDEGEGRLLLLGWSIKPVHPGRKVKCIKCPPYSRKAEWGRRPMATTLASRRPHATRAGPEERFRAYGIEKAQRERANTGWISDF